MAESVGALSVSISMDTQGFNTALSQTAQQLKLTQTQFQAAAASLGGFGASTDTLKLKAQMLSSEIAIQQERVEQLNAAVAASTEAKGADSSATANWQIRLNQANIALGNMQTALTATNEKIAAQSVETKTSGMSFSSFGAAALGAVGAIAAVGYGLVSLVKNGMATGTAIYDLGVKLGLTSQQAEQFYAMMQASGTSSQTVVTTLARLDKAIDTVGKSGNATTKMLEKWGIDAQTFSMANANDQLAMLADAYDKAGDKSAKFLQDVLGPRGSTLAPLLAQYKDLQATLSQIKFPNLDLTSLIQGQEQIKAVQAAFQMIGVQFAASIMPIIVQHIPAMVTGLQDTIIVIEKIVQAQTIWFNALKWGVDGAIGFVKDLVITTEALPAAFSSIAADLMHIFDPVVNIVGKVDPAFKASFDSWESSADKAAAGVKVSMTAIAADTQSTQQAQTADLKQMADAWNGVMPAVQKLKEIVSDTAVADDGLATSTGKVQTAEQQAATATDLLKTRLQILATQADIASAAIQAHGDKTAQLETQEEGLTKQIDIQKQIVQDATDNYDKLCNERLQNTKAGLDAQLEMVNEQKTLEDLQTKLDTVTQSLKDQQTALENQGVAVKALADIYNTDMANALDTYTQKVADAEAKETTDIQNATDAYTKSLTDRTNALMDFSKIFDVVTSTTVNPGDLVTNLQEQVTQMEQWQADLGSLAGKGVGTDMISQLQQLGVGSADQVHAMTQMTAQQLTQYVALWQEKQTDANTEATNELTVQQQDMQTKIALIQTTTASQLDQLKTTWQTETAKIQQDTETKLTDMATSAKTQGQAFMDNLSAAITTNFPKVQAVLQQLQTMLATVGTSTTGGTSASTTGQPLKHYAGGGAVDKTGPAFLDKDEYVLNQPTVAAFGGMSAVQSLVSSFRSGMAALSPGAMTPALAGAGNTYNSYYSITVNGNNPQQVLDYLDRQLNRRGVKKA